MKNRLHFIAPLIVIVTALIVGSFLDLNISQSFAALNNGFDKFITGFTTIPYGMIFAICSALTLSIGLKEFKAKKIKLFLLILAAILFFATGFYFGARFFVEAYELKKYFLFIIGACFSIPSFIVGLKIYKKLQSANLLRVLLLIMVFALVAVGITEILKLIAPRARYAYMASIDNFNLFRPWYAPRCEYLGDNSKSFPSGHANNAMLVLFCLLSFSYLKPQYRKYQLPLFYGGLVFYVLVSISRVHYGAHFLSDVSFSGLFNLCLIFIANEVFIRKLDLYSEKSEI